MNMSGRRKVFWLIKKYSSYSSWNALADAWRKFVREWEYALNHADSSDRELVQGLADDYKRLLDGEIAFERGVSELGMGNKNVFRANSAGYLRATLSVMSFSKRIMDPEEYVFDWAVNKDALLKAFELVESRRENIGSVFEQAGKKGVAPLRARDFCSERERGYIPAELPELQPPSEVVAFTGKEVPCDGIWEPEWEARLGLANVLRAKPADLRKGCMNYLVANTTAPYYRNDLNEAPFQVTWRLVWEDTRYRDGKIPDEESQYVLA